MTTPVKAIITGATGMVGEGVLHECLQHPGVAEVLLLSRKPYGLSHPKLREIIHGDFYDLSAVEDRLTGYNACFFCLGVSSVGMKEEEYYSKTYILTMHVAETLSRKNDGMTFCYVSGAGTDSTGQRRSMWARIKGKTENELMKLPFKQVFAYRPGYIHPTKGLKHAHRFYTFIGWLYPVGRALFPNAFCTLREVGLSMIRLARSSYGNRVIQGKEIIRLAREEVSGKPL